MFNSALRFTSCSFVLGVVLCSGCSAPGSFSGEGKRGRPPVVQGPNAIVCWGDSMTQGDQGAMDADDYPRILQAAIGPEVVNEGIGGQTSSQIGVRQGGVPTLVTVVGGVIPAAGGVEVRFATGYEPITSPTRTVHGSILGVKGVLTISDFLPAGKITFTPAPGNSVPVTVVGTPRFVPDTLYQNFLPIFWEGRNNLFATAAGPSGPAQIESDIAEQVASLPANLNYLVLPVINENYAGERKGAANYATLMGLDQNLAATYGLHYLDIRSILVASYDPSSPVDVMDHQYDMIPTSLGSISAQGTLVNSIGPTVTSFTVNLTAGTLIAYHNLVIDGESIRILKVNGSTVTLGTRGYGGLQSSHSAGAVVTQHDPTHLNKQGYTIVAKAVQSKLASM